MKWLTVSAIFLLFLFLAFYRLNEIPGEWYGDISIEHEYVSAILGGAWPHAFSLSAGPVYHYLIAPIVGLLGATYYSYKVASALTGVATLVSLFLLTRELTDSRVAIRSMVIAAISFWLLVQSRLGGSPQEVSPVLVSLTLYFLLVFRRTHLFLYLILAAGTGSLGVFTYPALFVLPFVVIGLLVAEAIFEKRGWRDVAMGLLAFIPCFIGMSFIVHEQPDNFLHGYIGTKIMRPELSWQEGLSRASQNFVNTMGMFHFRGDKTFRVNVPGRPQLDVISGFLLVLGIVSWLWSPWKRKTKYLVVPFLLLTVPAMWPALPPNEIPNSGRVFGVFPLIMIFAAWGLLTLENWIRRIHPYLATGLTAFVLLGILFFNVRQYFVEYASGLPNHNSPYAKIISEYIETLPPGLKAYLLSCCWGEAGQPEPKSIYYGLRKKEGRETLLGDFPTSCESIKGIGKAVFIGNPKEQDLAQFDGCLDKNSMSIHQDIYGQEVFFSVQSLP